MRMHKRHNTIDTHIYRNCRFAAIKIVTSQLTYPKPTAHQ